jgi:hypothetical protein
MVVELSFISCTVVIIDFLRSLLNLNCELLNSQGACTRSGKS